MQEPFYIITHSVYKSFSSRPRVAILYGLILGLSSNGPCYAGNPYLAERLDVSEREVQRMIKTLVETGFVSKERFGYKRLLKPNFIEPTKTTSSSPITTDLSPQNDESVAMPRHTGHPYNKEDNKEDSKERESAPSPEILNLFNKPDSDDPLAMSGFLPLKKFPELWFRPSELTQALEIHRERGLSKSDTRTCFQIISAKMSGLEPRIAKQRRTKAYSYAITWALEQTIELKFKTKKLDGTAYEKKEEKRPRFAKDNSKKLMQDYDPETNTVRKRK